MKDWVKVEDDLPKDEEMYLTYGIDGLTTRPYNPNYECWDTSDADDYYCDAVGGRITHWMEAPLPPAK